MHKENAVAVHPIQLQDAEFKKFQVWLYQATGINLSAAKKALVAGRLSKRLRHYSLLNYGDYFALIMGVTETVELQVAIDLLTTNETYFFRENKHFDFLREKSFSEITNTKPLRIWSAACSSGEEPYSIAMTLAEKSSAMRLSGNPWEILGSDISTHVLTMARKGHYPIERARNIPQNFLTKYCLKGIGRQDGTFLIDRNIRDCVQFSQINLNEALPGTGDFDVIFLRNVMIYFDLETKRKVMARLLPRLKPGGYFFVSHSESLNGITDSLKVILPSIYRKPLA